LNLGSLRTLNRLSSQVALNFYWIRIFHHHLLVFLLLRIQICFRLLHIIIFLYFVIASVKRAIVGVRFFLRFHLSWNHSVGRLVRLCKQLLRDWRFVCAEIVCVKRIIFVRISLILLWLVVSLDVCCLKLVAVCSILSTRREHLLILKLYLLLSLKLHLGVRVSWFSFPGSSGSSLSLSVFHFRFLFLLFVSIVVKHSYISFYWGLAV
jgi:hypothetical protein